MTCRKAHAAAFNPYVVFDRDQVEITGPRQSWRSSPGYDHRFCGSCGSRVVADNGEEVELSLGSFDEPGVLDPKYECWTIRREPWLPMLDLPQFDHNPTPALDQDDPSPPPP
ncbi:GFA family protein [Caulobacter sp. S45]|uniref:GFA family protein n=1 Tax=Caulobacter sp. S45 TaxID=1641861 RepID=UPI0020B177D2|nr:GFA family protein [Caulobacter sp. S45]